VQPVFAFEFIFTLFLFAWAFKADPRFNWIPVDLTLLFFILSVCSGILVFLVEKKRFEKKSTVIISSGILFVFYLLISLTWTVGNLYAGQKALYFSTLTLWTLIACAFIIASEKCRLARFINLLLLFAIWIAAESTLEYLRGGGDVINALNSNYLALGYSMGMGLVISTAYAFLTGHGRLKRAFLFLISLYFMFLLLILGGRGPLLSVTISLSIPLLFKSNLMQEVKPKLKKYASFIAVLFLAIISISVYLYTKGSLTATLYRMLLFLEPGMGSSAGTRIGYYLTSAELWSSNPLFGHGIGSWPILTGLPDSNSYPHNLIFEILVEVGLAGLILFGLIVFFALKGFIKSNRDKNIFFGAVILMMFVNAFTGAMLSGDLNDNRIIFALLGLMAFKENGNEKEGLHFDNSPSG
jgi:O-antigen ligase